MKKKRLAAITFALAFGLGCGSDDDALADAGRVADAPPADGDAACPPSGIAEADATRSTGGGSVTVAATFRNALAHCAKDEVAFTLVFDTHSVDVSAIDVRAASIVETSAGDVVADLRWEAGSVSSHHVAGVLRGTAPPLTGAIWLRLTVRDVAGTDRVFEWDESLLAHDLP